MHVFLRSKFPSSGSLSVFVLSPSFTLARTCILSAHAPEISNFPFFSSPLPPCLKTTFFFRDPLSFFGTDFPVTGDPNPCCFHFKNCFFFTTFSAREPSTSPFFFSTYSWVLHSPAGLLEKRRAHHLLPFPISLSFSLSQFFLSFPLSGGFFFFRRRKTSNLRHNPNLVFNLNPPKK